MLLKCECVDGSSVGAAHCHRHRRDGALLEGEPETFLYIECRRITRWVRSQHHDLTTVLALALGQHVAAGQVIGYVGHSGDARGDHVHFEIATKASIYSFQVNPGPFMRARGVPLGAC